MTIVFGKTRHDRGKAGSELALSLSALTLLFIVLLLASCAAAAAQDVPREPAPRVVAVTPPEGSLAPANLLRLRIAFSEPMRRGEAARRLRLSDSGGSVVEGALRETAQELWDPSGTALTIILNPGRLKSGVAARRMLESPLESGAVYTLTIAQGWPSRAGGRTRETHRTSFQTAPPEHRELDPDLWRIEPPRTGSRDALDVTFPRMMDPMQLEMYLAVSFESERVPGVAQATPDGHGWRFVPHDPWRVQNYKLVGHPRLEDIAGNTVSAPFDHALGAEDERAGIARVFTPIAQVQ